MSSFFDFTDEKRIRYSKISICLSLLVIIAISFRLWLNERNYPIAPLFDWIPILPSPIDWLQLIVIAGLTVLVAIVKKPAPYIFGYVVFYFLFAFEDQNRLQPYYYMYAFMLLAIALYKKTQNSATLTLHSLRIIIVGTYFWAGIQKLNWVFIARFYPYIAGSEYSLPGFDPDDTLRKYFILIIPLIEMLIPIGLLVNRTRNVALQIVVMMHISIMLFLSPLVYGWNMVVIPWNLGLLFVNIFLFWKVDKIDIFEFISPARSLVKSLIILLFIFMPILNFYGLWDHYLSSSLYSFKPKYSKIYVDKELQSKLPEYLSAYYESDEKGEYIETTYWMFGEINTAPYPEERIFKQIEQFICSFDDKKPCSAKLEIYGGRPDS